MSKIPEPARQRLIDRLSGPFGHARLQVDGRDVTFQVRRYSDKPLTYRIVPFVDGTFRHGWAIALDGMEPVADQEIGRRLMRQRYRSLFTGKRLKQHNRVQKILGKKPMTQEENRRTYWDLWHCPKALVRHLEREFDSIEILEPSDAAA